MEKKRLAIVIATTILLGTLFGLGIGALVFRVDILNSMVLRNSANLQVLFGFGGNESAGVTAYDWGAFDHRETKSMNNGVVYLVNDGNGPANVTWGDMVSPDWRVNVYVYNDTLAWDSGQYLTIDYNGYVPIFVTLQEWNAQGGVPYEFQLSFLQEGIA